MDCNNPDCQIITRPATQKKYRQNQLHKGCSCGSPLTLHPCGASASLYQFKVGIHYQHTGQHNHPIPPRTLHLLPHQRAQFERIIRTNIQTGAASLVNSAPGRSSVADIAPPLLNINRVRSEQKKIRAEVKAEANAFAPSIEEWISNNPNYMRYEERADDFEVICLQSPFMATLPLFDQSDVTDPEELANELPATSGLITDGAHGFWSNKKSLLMVTSSYSKTLLAWIPVMIAYSNGQTKEHYRCYFSVLIKSIVEDGLRRGFSIEDMMEWGLGGVCFQILCFILLIYI